jgi:hypothetical protein
MATPMQTIFMFHPLIALLFDALYALRAGERVDRDQGSLSSASTSRFRFAAIPPPRPVALTESNNFFDPA